jgi:hypothetical protein
MSEVCPQGCSQRGCEIGQSRRSGIRSAQSLSVLITNSLRPHWRLTHKYQNTIRNTYLPVPHPPQTRAAHFKRLYRK